MHRLPFVEGSSDNTFFAANIRRLNTVFLLTHNQNYLLFRDFDCVIINLLHKTNSLKI
tara:strand:- start:9423 stop:9596 length:174 start_codon:yes stop_codon:yes gene_type:complete